MKLNFSLDLHKNSSWSINTISAVSKKMPFYVMESGHFMAKKTYYTEREGYDGYLLMYTISGSGNLKFKGKDYFLEPDDVIIINYSDYHLYKTNIEPWDFKWIYFNGTSAENFSTLLYGDSPEPVKIVQITDFEKSLDNIYSISRLHDLPSVFQTSSIMSDIYSKIVENKISIANNREFLNHKYEIEKVIGYIHLNYQKQISLDDLTKVAHLSKYHFLRIFKENIGIGPYEYLITYRINKAKELLVSTDNTVGYISKYIGFNDYVNFIRTFKKFVDVTPLKYRKRANVRYFQ